MNIYDKAWDILELFVPGIKPESFEGLTVDPNKTKAENKAIMLREIADGKLSPILAVAAHWLLEHQPSSEESETLIIDTNLEEVKQELEAAYKREGDEIPDKPGVGVQNPDKQKSPTKEKQQEPRPTLEQ